MKRVPRSLFLLLISFLVFSCKQGAKTANALTVDNAGINTKAIVKGAPDWILQGNVYEVNVRQYTPEGTFNAFAKHLDRLKEMGVQTLWFMPINPISKKDRKGTLGSYYAVADYTDVNPEFGTMNDWKNLVKSIHQKGMKVIIDWVPNHTGADHRWLTQHPDFYMKDSTGKFISPYDWTDVKKLDYRNTVLQDSMINAMKFWITDTDIDGFRCDHAHGIIKEFWSKCNAELKKVENVLMLAESEDRWVNENGFDMSYSWRAFHAMVDVAAGKAPANILDSINRVLDTIVVNNGMQLYFTSNHDENSWNKADYGTMPGKVHAPFAVLTQTARHSIPLIYSGQEEPVLRPIQFFEKDPIQFSKFARAPFYKTLLNLRTNNKALAGDAAFRKVNAGNEKAVYAYTREKGGKRVLVVLNLSSKPQNITINDASLHGNTRNVFMGTNEQLTNKQWQMEPWGYAVYEY
jgi:alpha-amylase